MSRGGFRSGIFFMLWVNILVNCRLHHSDNAESFWVAPLRRGLLHPHCSVDNVIQSYFKYNKRLYIKKETACSILTFFNSRVVQEFTHIYCASRNSVYDIW